MYFLLNFQLEILQYFQYTQLLNYLIIYSISYHFNIFGCTDKAAIVGHMKDELKNKLKKTVILIV